TLPKRKKPQSDVGEKSVHQQNLEPEFIAEQHILRIRTQYVRENWRQHADVRHPTIAHLSLRKNPEREHSQQRTIGVASGLEYRGHHTLVVDDLKHDNHRANEQAESHVHEYPR